MADPRRTLQAGDALLIVDVQNDFCPGGALPIPNGDAIVPPLNRWIAAAIEAGVPVFASRDWHPLHHLSFRESGGQWPPHCVQDTDGARFHPDLALPPTTVMVAKGIRFDRDQYSAFDETGLASEFERRGIGRVFVGGLAQEICVHATVLGARRAGFETVVIADGTCPLTPAGGEAANAEMRHAGVSFETTDGA